MILVYDGSGKQEKLFKDIMAPTGIEYQIMNKISSNLLEKTKPTSLIYYLDGSMKKEDAAIFLEEHRGYLLILLSEHKEPKIDEKIRYTSELVLLDPTNIEETRKRLRQALSGHIMSKLKVINNTTIYLAKNGLYPGNTYFTKPENTPTFMSLLISNRVNKDSILLVSRFNLKLEMPEILTDENFIWVTDSMGAQRNRPVNLTFIVDSIIKRISENKAHIVFIDVFDLLIVYHSFYDVARAFEQIKSIALERNAYLVLVFGEGSMDHIQFGQITRYCLDWNRDMVTDLEA